MWTSGQSQTGRRPYRWGRCSGWPWLGFESLVAELLADGPVNGLAGAEELYSALCAETLGDERVWIALFRIYERTGSLMGLDSAVRRYRSALIELGATDVTDVDSVPLPDNLERLVQKIKQRIQ